LADALHATLGSDIALVYSQPQPPGGVVTTADDYARFLRKLLRNELQLGALLGAHAVCTNPAGGGRRRVQQRGRVRLLSVDRRGAALLRRHRAARLGG